jgi:DNA-binding PadR family transcriptional regulator
MIGNFQLLVLLAILRAGKEAYGGEVVRLCSIYSKEHHAPQIYTALRSLEEKYQMVSSAPAEATGKRGRPRRMYSLTVKGQAYIKPFLRIVEGIQKEKNSLSI